MPSALRIARFVAVALAALSAPFLSRPASACSVCRCGDVAFTALGLNIYETGAFRIAIDWDRLEKDQGPKDERESVVENRLTATLSTTIGEYVTIMARVPAARRSLSSPEGNESGRGLADPEFQLLTRVWASPFGELGRRAWIGASLGVKTSWGENDLEKNGERLDEHVQPGTGSTDGFAGLSGIFVIDPDSTLFASVQERWPGSNRYGYRYGRVTLANLGYERRLGGWFDAAVELNARSARRDRIADGGLVDGDTGGRIVYVTPKILLNLGEKTVARLSVQIPVVDRLNGDQRERSVYSAGITYVFGQ
jgi:hypothetical protein